MTKSALNAISAALWILLTSCGARTDEFDCVRVSGEDLRNEIEAAVLAYKCGNYGNEYRIGQTSALYPQYSEYAPGNRPGYVRNCILGKTDIDSGDDRYVYVRAENAEGRAVGYFQGSGYFTVTYRNGRFVCEAGDRAGRKSFQCHPVQGVPIDKVFPEPSLGIGQSISAIFASGEGSYICDAASCRVESDGAALIRYRPSRDRDTIFLKVSGAAALKPSADGALSCAQM